MAQEDLYDATKTSYQEGFTLRTSLTPERYPTELPLAWYMVNVRLVLKPLEGGDRPSAEQVQVPAKILTQHHCQECAPT